jgi:cytochrome c553
MRWTRWAAVGTCCGGIALISLALSCSSTQQAGAPAGGAMTAEQKIARGKLISWYAGCNDCHTPGTFYGTPDTTRLLSGSELGWAGPWGVTYPRNLTPDSTGLAAWSEEQIVTAFRTGHRPDGSPLLPPMPWPAYAHMPDDEAYALAAYLKSLPPVHHRPPDRLPPGATPPPATLVFPAPPAWDGQNLPPPPTEPAAAGGATQGH